MLTLSSSTAVVDAIHATRDDVARRLLVLDSDGLLFAPLLPLRLDGERRDGNSFALDLWLSELAIQRRYSAYHRFTA